MTGAMLSISLGGSVVEVEKLYRRGRPVVGARRGQPFASQLFDLQDILAWFAERDGRDPRKGEAA